MALPGGTCPWCGCVSSAATCPHPHPQSEHCVPTAPIHPHPRSSHIPSVAVCPHPPMSHTSPVVAACPHLWVLPAAAPGGFPRVVTAGRAQICREIT